MKHPRLLLAVIAAACALGSAVAAQVAYTDATPEGARITVPVSPTKPLPVTSPAQAPATAGAATATAAQLAAAQYNSTAPTLATTNQGPLQIDSRGNLHVSLFAAETANPLSIAAPADNLTNSVQSLRVNALPEVFDGTNWQRQKGDANGAVSQMWALSGARWNYAAAASGIVNTTTAVTIKTAAGASVKNYLTSCQIATDTLGGATELVIRDGAAGTVLWRSKLQTTAMNPLTVTFGAPLAGTANTLMEVAALTAVTGGVYVNCQGFTGS